MIDIWCFIAQDNRQAADYFIRQIEKRFESILVQPEIGPARDHIRDGLRVHFHRDYAIYYHNTAAEIIIVRVVHGARDVRSMVFEE